MKKTYLKPTIEVKTLQEQDFICTSNDVSRVNGNADIDYGGGGNGPARARGNGGTDWDDEW
jgi:hypothetical protein